MIKESQELNHHPETQLKQLDHVVCILIVLSIKPTKLLSNLGTIQTYSFILIVHNLKRKLQVAINIFISLVNYIVGDRGDTGDKGDIGLKGM